MTDKKNDYKTSAEIQTSYENQPSTVVVGGYVYSGPVPPAAEFAKYSEVLPDAPDRILKLVEREQQNKIETDRALISMQKFGLLIGFILILCASSLIAYALFLGENWVAGVITALFSTVAVLFKVLIK